MLLSSSSPFSPAPRVRHLHFPESSRTFECIYLPLRTGDYSRERGREIRMGGRKKLQKLNSLKHGRSILFSPSATSLPLLFSAAEALPFARSSLVPFHPARGGLGVDTFIAARLLALGSSPFFSRLVSSSVDEGHSPRAFSL